jgi:hypothetical protein
MLERTSISIARWLFCNSSQACTGEIAFTLRVMTLSPAFNRVSVRPFSSDFSSEANGHASIYEIVEYWCKSALHGIMSTSMKTRWLDGFETGLMDRGMQSVASCNKK